MIKLCDRDANEQALRSVLVVGAGVAGWLSACYLKHALPGVRLRVLELPQEVSPERACIAPAELHQLVFEPLGVAEADWMRACHAAPHAAVNFINWRTPRSATPDDHFFHVLSSMPEVADISLYHHWLLRRRRGDRQPMEYACFKEPKLLDAKLAPCCSDGSAVMRYAWQLEPRRLACYLRTLAASMGVETSTGELASVSLADDGTIAALRLRQAELLEADLYLDCSGGESVLLQQALAEPFCDGRSELWCDSMLGCSVEHTGVAEGVDPFVSAIAMSSGWVAKVPLLDRFASSYVYSSAFLTDAAALREMCWVWGLPQPPTDLWLRRFRTGRAQRAWIGNCVAIGDAYSFVEPLRAGELQRACTGLRVLAARFPDRRIHPLLRDRYNLEMARTFEELRDSTQLSYLATPRSDGAFWQACKHDLRAAASLSAKLDGYGPALAVDTPAPLIDCCGFNGAYCAILAGMGWLPQRPLPSLLYRPELQHRADQTFARLKQDSDQLYALLPTNREWLRCLHSDRIDRWASRPV